MAECHGTAIDVDAVAVDIKIANEFFGHNRKRLINFEQINIGQRHARLVQNLFGSGYRRIEHQRRAVAHIRHGNHAGARLHAVCFGIIVRCQKQRGGPVHNTR